MICILPNCKNEIPSARLLRKQGVTCCADHGQIHSINRMTRRRAGNRKVHNCGNKDCNRVFIDFGKGDTFCSKCRGSKMGRCKLGRKEDYNYVSTGRDGGGKFYQDFRLSICKADGKCCVNYSKCSDSAAFHKKGLFEYQKNGGVNCYIVNK